MSTKKRFNIAPDLAHGIRSTVQSASANQGQLHYDMMSIDVIEPDPDNPRQLSLSRDELTTELNPSEAGYQTKLKELEGLHELVASIKRVGIRNAIEVYKVGQKYRIVSGERRYLASILAGLRSVPVRISQKPNEFHLRYTQWVENMHRQDLSLWEKFNNLVAISDSYKMVNQIELSDKWLQVFLGVSTVQAYRYVCLLKASDNILELVRLGKLNNLKIVQELVSLKDKGALRQILSWIASSKNEVTSLANYRAAAGKKTPASRLTAKNINLGKISHLSTAQYLMKTVLADTKLAQHRHRFDRVDWSCHKSISEAFKDLFRTLDIECRVEEKTS